ncbi:MAG: type 2 lantipeptide synthetase LanM [Ardenticatenaceae bacterium]|nr:type 2 lantipeptide synthetase LanM [Ardenticatenaceae bacterium]
MEFSIQTLKRIVENGSPLHERLNGKFDRSQASLLSKANTKRLDTWSKLVAQNSSELLQKRWQWDKLNEQEVFTIMENPQWKNELPLPSWSKVLSRAVEMAQHLKLDGLKNKCDFLIPAAPFPFEELLLPFILVAKEELSKQQHHENLQISLKVEKKLLLHLLQQLANLSEQTFYLEFSIFRAQNRYQPNLKSANAGQNNTLYQLFLNKLFSGGFVAFFEEYAVLARLLSITVLQWVQWLSELSNRLDQDWPEITCFFDLPGTEPCIIDIQSGLSDPHHDGRTVAIITLEGESKLVYKPKDLGFEKGLSNLSDWLTQQGIPYPTKSLKILNYEEYGWVEYVETAECEDEAALCRYFERIGSLLCLVYLLEGTDCHGENLMAVGEYPVLIDVETFLHPRLMPASSNELSNGAQNLAYQQYMSSVLRTGMLPVWMFGNGGQSFDISGLGAIAGQEIPYNFLSWKHINSDDMSSLQATAVAQQANSMPIFNNQAISPEGYLSEIVTGFSETYDFFLAHKQDAAFIEKMESFFQAKQGRFLFRNTISYFLLLKKLLHPKYMRNGIDRSIQLDVLCRYGLSSKNKPNYWPLFHTEIKSMEKLDVPYFITQADDPHIYAAEGLIAPDLFSQPGVSFLRDHLSQLTEADKDLQIGLIYSVFSLRFTEKESTVENTDRTTITLAENLDKLAAIKSTATEIADKIIQKAIVASNGSASWLGLEYMSEFERSLIQPLGHNLHSGNCGISFFLAGSYKVTGEDKYKQMSLAALHQVRTAAQKDKNTKNLMSERMSLGAAIGLGSMIYSLSRISHLIQEPKLLEDAQLVAGFITPDRIEQDTKIDVMDGTAGALLGLLALYEATQAEEILLKAKQCGDHLLKTRKATKGGELVWLTTNDRFLTGFSHGAAGISYALFRLYRASGQQEYYAAAVEGINFENRLYNDQIKNWPDLLRSTDTEIFYGQTWCHGAPGIGLARLGGIPVFDNPDVHRDIQVALNTTMSLFNDNLDTLCCGNAGRWDLLLKAGTDLQEAKWINRAREEAYRTIQQRTIKGHFQLPYSMGTHGEIFQIGFFQGLSGLGYQLLRAIDPTLPSVLLWE